MEGLAREIINRIQRMRKDADLEVEDRIQVHYQTDSALLKEAIETHGDLLSEETLSVEVSASESQWHSDSHSIEGDSITIAFNKA